MSADPMLLSNPSVSIDAPRALSAFTYAFDNPLAYVDPDGRFPWLIIPAFVAIGFGFESSDNANIAPIIALTPIGALLLGATGVVMTGAQIGQLQQIRDDVIASGMADDPEIQTSLDDIDSAIKWGIVTGGLEAALTAVGAKGALGGGKRSLQRARRARDALAADLAPLKGKAPATVTGGVNVKTGEVAARACGGGKCAEEQVANALGGSKRDIRFTEAVRPRTGKEVPVCGSCETRFGRGAFPKGAKFKTDNNAGKR